MSGPKGYGYSVVSAEELARREAERARAALAAVVARLRELMARAAVVGVHHAAPATTVSAGATAAQIRAVTAGVERAIADVEAALQERRATIARAELAQVIGALDTSALGNAAAATAREAPTRAPRTSAPETTHRDARTRLEKALAAASVLEDAERERISALAASVSEALASDAPHPAALAISRLEGAVVDAVTAQRQRHARDRRRTAIATANADLTGPAADAARARLDAAESLADFDRVTREFAALRETARAEADRQYVLATSLAVLRDMGYQVSETVSGGVAPTLIVADAHWPRHRLRIVLDPGRSEMHTSPVAITTTDERDDVRFERASCAALAGFTTRLAERGVTTALHRQRAPGDVPVIRDHPEERGRARTTAKERTLGEPRA